MGWPYRLHRIRPCAGCVTGGGSLLVMQPASRADQSESRDSCGPRPAPPRLRNGPLMGLLLPIRVTWTHAGRGRLRSPLLCADGLLWYASRSDPAVRLVSAADDGGRHRLLQAVSRVLGGLTWARGRCLGIARVTRVGVSGYPSHSVPCRTTGAAAIGTRHRDRRRGAKLGGPGVSGSPFLLSNHGRGGHRHSAP